MSVLEICALFMDKAGPDKEASHDNKATKMMKVLYRQPVPTTEIQQSSSQESICAENKDNAWMSVQLCRDQYEDEEMGMCGRRRSTRQSWQLSFRRKRNQ